MIISLKTHRINDGKLSSQNYHSNERYLYFWAEKNFWFSCMRAHRHIIFADTSGLFNGDRLIIALKFTSPSKIQISGNRSDSKTEIQKHIPYKKKGQNYIKLTWSRVATTWSVLYHSTNEIIPRDTCARLQTRIIRDNQKRSGFANKITKTLEIWIKRSVKQFLKSKSTFRNNIYRTVAFSQVF